MVIAIGAILVLNLRFSSIFLGLDSLDDVESHHAAAPDHRPMPDQMPAVPSSSKDVTETYGMVTVTSATLLLPSFFNRQPKLLSCRSASNFGRALYHCRPARMEMARSRSASTLMCTPGQKLQWGAGPRPSHQAAGQPEHSSGVSPSCQKGSQFWKVKSKISQTVESWY